MAESLYIKSITITPNPVQTRAQFKIEVEIYTLFPDPELYPSTDLYPGSDLFTLFPDPELFPGTDIYPTEGELEI